MTLSQADINAVDDIVKHVMLTGPQPGVVVSITGPRGDYNQAYGLSKIVAPKTKMNVLGHVRVGSITKLITGLAVLNEIGSGRLSMTDTLNKFVAGVPAGDQITIQHMMTMRSGVFEYTQDPDWQKKSYLQPSSKYIQDEVLALVRKNPSRFTPGSKYDYADSNWVLLGMVLESVTGKRHEDVIKGVITQLGLKQTSYPLGNATGGTKVPTPITYGYRPNPLSSVWASAPPQDITVQNPEMFGASGGIISTVGDLQLLGQKLRDGALLTPQMRELRDTLSFPVPWTYEGPKEFGYGLGYTFFGTWRGHGGSIPGYTTVCMYDSVSGAVITVAENFQTPDAQAFTRIWWRIANYLYPGSVTQAELSEAA